MERLLITGVDGVVGANLALTLSDRFEVIGLYHSQLVELPGCRVLPCGANGPELSAAVRGEAPDWVIHCGPLTTSAWGSLPVGLDREPLTITLLADGVAHVGGLLTCLTSDAVFAGPALFHDESGARQGVGSLADTIRQVEDMLAAHSAQTLTVRTHAYGWGLSPSEAGFVERCWQASIEGTPLAANADWHATPILATDLADLLAAAWQRRLRGVCHLAGAERASPVRLAVELSRQQGERCPLAPLDPTTEARFPARETSLGTRRGRRELAQPMPLLREGLARFAAQAINGHRDRLLAAAGGTLCGAAA